MKTGTSPVVAELNLKAGTSPVTPCAATTWPAFCAGTALFIISFSKFLTHSSYSPSLSASTATSPITSAVSWSSLAPLQPKKAAQPIIHKTALTLAENAKPNCLLISILSYNSAKGHGRYSNVAQFKHLRHGFIPNVGVETTTSHRNPSNLPSPTLELYYNLA